MPTGFGFRSVASSGFESSWCRGMSTNFLQKWLEYPPPDMVSRTYRFGGGFHFLSLGGGHRHNGDPKSTDQEVLVWAYLTEFGFDPLTVGRCSKCFGRKKWDTWRIFDTSWPQVRLEGSFYGAVRYLDTGELWWTAYDTQVCGLCCGYGVEIWVPSDLLIRWFRSPRPSYQNCLTVFADRLLEEGHLAGLPLANLLNGCEEGLSEILEDLNQRAHVRQLEWESHIKQGLGV